MPRSAGSAATPVRSAVPSGAVRGAGESANGTASLVKSANRVLMIFELIAADGAQTFSGIATALALPPSSTHNLLKTLVRRGYLQLDDDRRYRLGLRLWEVAQAYVTSDSIIALARPIMDRVVAATGETVQLAQLDGVENVYLAISESPQPMKLVSAVGKRLYAHATGLGKVLLAGLPDDEVRRRLSRVDLPRFTPNTVVDLDSIVSILGEVRRCGFAADDEEYVIGCRCIAMPVRDAHGAVVAAMSVSIPTPRYTSDLAARTHEALGAAVGELSARLGHVG